MSNVREMPVCAVCNKNVDRIESIGLEGSKAKLYRAYCHGECDHILVTAHEMRIGFQYNTLVCFKDRKVFYDEKLQAFKEYLELETPNWLAKITDEELTYFMKWAAKTQVYPINKNYKIASANTFDAFRGFCMGLKYSKGKL